jgi:histidine ammonia-lyase
VGAKEYPLFCEVRQEGHAALLPRAILEGQPYPIRALVISGSSVITAWPNPKLWRRALAALDLLVVINRFPTADVQYADLVLPATTPFENESFMFYDGHVQLRQRVIEPLGEARSDYLIFAELARRLGYGDRWPQSEDAMIARALEGSGVTLAQLREHPQGLPLESPPLRHYKHRTGHLRADGRPGFETPTGRFEFASEWLRQHGHDALPVYTEPREGPLASPELVGDFPLVLNSGARTQWAFRSQHHNVASLVAKQPAPEVHIHRRDAQARGIADGDEVEVVSPRGRVPFRARVSEDVVAGAVEVNMGGGGPLGPAAWRRANANELTDLENRDPISGFPVYKALLCDVRKCDGVASMGHSPGSETRPVVLDGSSLTLATLERLATRRATATLSDAAWERIAAGRAVVERLLASGKQAYGVNTGVGSQKDFRVDPEQTASFNRRLLVAQATVMTGDSHRPEAVRAAIAVLVNGFASGRSGVRPRLVESLLAMIAADEVPRAAAGSSVGAADLVPLAQIALRVIGVPSPLAADPPASAPLPSLAGKEALSLMSSNAVSLGRGALALLDVERLLDAMSEAACLSLEGFRGNASALDPAIGRSPPQAGQQTISDAMRRRLEGSQLLTPAAARFLQDPLSFRCAAQILGALRSTLDWVRPSWERALNGAQDNPLVLPDEDRLVSHGNMDTTLLTVGIDALRSAIAAAVEAASQRLHKLHWPAFSGLPVGLAEGARADGGVQYLNLGHLAAAAAAQVRARAAPVAQAYSAQLADGVEDYATPLPLAVSSTERQLDEAWRLLTIEVVVACWAITRRGLRAEQIGRGLRETFETIRALLPIGHEGQQVFDLRPVTALLRQRATTIRSDR